MALGGDAVALWLKMTGPQGMARALEGIAGARIQISTALGLPPVNREGDQGHMIRYGVCFGAGHSFDEFDGWRRWLSIATTGTAALVPTEELAAARSARQLASAAVSS